MEIKVESSSIGERIKKAREEKGISQKAFSEHGGWFQSEVSRWERGKRNPDVNSVIKICKVLGVTSDYILGI